MWAGVCILKEEHMGHEVCLLSDETVGRQTGDTPPLSSGFHAGRLEYSLEEPVGRETYYLSGETVSRQAGGKLATSRRPVVCFMWADLGTH